MNASTHVLSTTSVILGLALLSPWEDPPPSRPPIFQRTDRLVGMDLMDSTGASIGRVEELVLDPDGSIRFIVVEASVNGRTRLYPISWPAIEFQTLPVPPSAAATEVVGKMMTDCTSDRLEFAPSFEPGPWPEERLEIVLSSADKFWVRGAGVATRAPSTYLRSTTLPNAVITDSSGTPIGTLGPVVADPVNGRVTYASVNLTGGRAVVLPWALLQTSSDKKESFRVSISRLRLQNAPEFLEGKDKWKLMSDPAWVEQVYSFYSVAPYWKSKGT